MIIHFPGKASDFLKIGVAAAARGDVESVREILKAKPKWIHKVGSHGRTMLWAASHRGKLPMVKYLIRRKADINACGTHYTPYFVEVSCYCIARFKKHHEVADWLLSKGAVLDIHTTAFLGDVDGVKGFLKKNRKLLNAGHPQYCYGQKNDPIPGLFLADADWATPLCYALRGGSVETVEYLIGRKARIQGFEEKLFIAADDNPQMVGLLLENNADPAHAPKAHPDDEELYAVVSKFGVKRPSKRSDSDELVYLCRGDRGGNPTEVARLLSHGADVNHQDHKGKTALHRAAKAGFIETMQTLIEHGARIDVLDNDGETALFDAVRSTIRKVDRKKEAIRLLIKSGADVRLENRKNQSLVSIASKSKRAETPAVLRLLKTQ
ncbi:MAG: ankyrin repeat domain-containing protein [Planctomycetaceae bacterium]